MSDGLFDLDPAKLRAAGPQQTFDTGRRPWGVLEQRCQWCDTTKPVSEFARTEKGWITRECRACADERLACWAKAPQPTGRRHVDENATHLTCTKCGRHRPKDLFYSYTEKGHRRLRYRPKCKQCTYAEQAFRQRGNSPDQKRRDRDRWLRRKYGISLVEYEFLLECQGGRCGICGTDRPGGPTPDSAFHVDHDHETKRVRGLLCRSCNTALGLLKEDPAIIASLLAYAMQGGLFEQSDDEWPGCRDHKYESETADG